MPLKGRWAERAVDTAVFHLFAPGPGEQGGELFLAFSLTCSRSHMTSEKRAAELIRAIELPKFYAPQTVMATGSIREGGTYEKDSSM